MGRDIRLGDIDHALTAGLGAVEALRTWVRSSDAFRSCTLREQAIRDGEVALRHLREVWPKAQALLAEADRAYDRYVQRDPVADSCSCHINPPCSFCMSQVDEDEARASALSDLAALDGETL